MLRSLSTQILNPAGTCCSFTCWALFTQQAKAMSERPNETFGYSALDGRTRSHLAIPKHYSRFRDSIPHIIYVYIMYIQLSISLYIYNICIILYIYIYNTQQIIHSFVKFRETFKRSASISFGPWTQPVSASRLAFNKPGLQSYEPMSQWQWERLWLNNSKHKNRHFSMTHKTFSRPSGCIRVVISDEIEVR